MPNDAVEVNNLIKIYNGASAPAVNDITFTVPCGAVFGLLGPNGAGKTTTISMLCGLIKPDAGTIKIAGLSPATDLKKIKLKIGVVPQEIALYPTLTAFENLRYIGNMYGLRGQALTAEIDKYLDIFGLLAVAKKRIDTFSGGMKRRINLIAGILHKPEILFLDEPTVGVDVQSRHIITENLKLINQNGCTIIYTSHLMEEAEQLCTHINIIDHGKIIIEGIPAELIATHQTENLEQLFLKFTGKKLRD